MKKEDRRVSREYLRKMSKLQRRESRDLKRQIMREAKDFDQFKHAVNDYMGF